MCGIAGIIDYSLSTIDQSLLSRFSDALRHRGPDDKGIVTGTHFGLVSRRLSVIDLSDNGHMPMANTNGTLHISYNGEVYNFIQIRKELESRGHVFHSGSDTEVVLRSYEEWRENCVHKFFGMFAFAVWNTETQKLFLCRDRLGVKPLFYRILDKQLLFSSELHALYLDHQPSIDQLNYQALDYYLSFGYVPPDITIQKNIQKLLPGEWLYFSKDGVEKKTYWQLSPRPLVRWSEKEALDATENELRQAVKRRLISDVPIGCFLSGGIDSALIVALASIESNKPIQTYTVGFEGTDNRFDERSLARKVALKYRTDHTELIVGPEGKNDLPLLLWHFGEPFFDISSLAVYQISKAARQHITVALTGDGGDESFAGYANVKAAWRAEQIRNHLPALFRKFFYLLPHPKKWRTWSQQYVEQDVLMQFNLLNHWHIDLRRKLFPAAGQTKDGYLAAQQIISDIISTAKGLSDPEMHLFIDLHLRLPGDYLTKIDIASNLASLEVRSPFLDHNVVQLAAQLPISLRLKNGNQKYLLRKLAHKYLPAELLYQPKRGFSPNLGKWIRDDWSQVIKDFVAGSLAERKDLFDATLIRNLVDDHMERREDHTTRIWELFCLEIWWQLFIDRSLKPSDLL